LEEKNMNGVKAVVVVLLVALVLASCAPGANELVNTKDNEGEVVGFWRGIWHGFIAPFTFIISLFSKTVGVYEAHNNGGWYNFGFIIGLSIIFGGSSGGAASRRRR
jgi:hypothetical protein